MAQDTSAAAMREAPADVRARETEQQMTDDERFSLIISLSGATRFFGGVRDSRYPSDAGDRGLYARRAAARRPGAVEQ
jgi:hypothetical protein